MFFSRSAHSNAYFYGFGSNKRIVLYDTLIEKGILPSEDDEKKDKPETDDKGEEKENKEEETEQTNKEESPSTDEKQTNKEESPSTDEKQTNEEESPSTDEKKDKTTGCNVEEILAVLCHELGHWNFSHTLKLMAMNQVLLNYI